MSETPAEQAAREAREIVQAHALNARAHPWREPVKAEPLPAYDLRDGDAQRDGAGL